MISPQLTAHRGIFSDTETISGKNAGLVMGAHWAHAIPLSDIFRTMSMKNNRSIWLQEKDRGTT